MTTRANLYIDQGVDFVTSLNLFTDAGAEFDITSQQFYCDVKKLYSSTTLFSADIVIEPQGLVGSLELIISANTTVDIDPGKYQYDLIMVSNTGYREKILEGLMFILPTITRG